MATTLLGAALLGREGEGEGGAGPSDASTLGPLPPPAKHEKVRLKGKGLGEDDLSAANAEVRAAIEALSVLLEGQPLLQLRVAENESELLDALKLYRDMNHLSLAGGITCDQVVEHVLSHTVILFYRPDIEQDYIPVTAATFTMRQTSMMLRLLATHPRMTRKGFGRITVHFLKELCRALHKDDIIVYTYPSSSPFYKALHFPANSGNGSKRARGGGTPNSAGSAADDERHQQQRGRWLASVTPAYTPGDATSSSTEGDDANSSPRKRGRGQSAKEEYAVEKIVDVQRNASDPSDVKYMIKWKGWPSKYNTWEPLAHLQNLQQEIEAFETSRAADKA